jgi:opacity protein-like surface antigen
MLKGIFVSVLLLLSTYVCADSFFNELNNFWKNTKNNYYIGGQLGYIHNGIQNHYSISPDASLDPLAYDTTSEHNNYLDYGVNGGLVTKFSPHWRLHWGVGYYNNVSQKLNGSYYERVGGSADLNYKTTLKIWRLMLETRTYYIENSRWSYFFGLDLGQANLSSSGVDTSQNLTLSFPPSLSLNNKTNFSYQLSLGVSFNLNPHWALTAAISQLSLGKLTMQAKTKNTNYTIVNKNLLTTRAWFGFSYNF